MLPENKLLNPLLSALDIKLSDRIICIKECGNADSNFVITHLMKQIFHQENNICLVILHNTLSHYQNVCKRLGFDFLKKVEERSLHVLEPLEAILENIGISDNFIDNKEDVVRLLFLDIKNVLEELKSDHQKQTYLIIDDLSHFLDLGVDLKYILGFINSCVNFTSLGNVSIIINTHVCNKLDGIICKSLNYVSDVNIEVCPLKTGLSREVTGVINVEKVEDNTKKRKQYHFKAFDKGIKTFHPGESIYNLYK